MSSPSPWSSVTGGFAAVQARVRAACVRAGRPPGAVELVAVSKLQPPEALREAHAAGARAFGENYAQELRDKSAALGDLAAISWHAIGPLQTNKAKYVAKLAHAFHALDRVELAEALSRLRVGAPLRCFLEVKLAAESSKGGVAPEAVPALVARVAKLPNLALVGLMALPPLEGAAEASRPYFRALAGLGRSLGLAELSMGTTHDFEVAIEEGATLVRVGTAIFGARPGARTHAQAP